MFDIESTINIAESKANRFLTDNKAKLLVNDDETKQSKNFFEVKRRNEQRRILRN
jgi:hypothetical protein